MRVHLIKQQTIEDYAAGHASTRPGFEFWLTAVKNADWQVPEDMQATFGTADLLGGGSDRVIFDIGGNKCRMICKYYFGARQVHLYVCWIGTHAAYDRLCDKKEQFTVSDY